MILRDSMCAVVEGEGHVEEKLGKIAMRVIGFGIVGALVLVLVAKGVDGFPFEVWGLIGGIVLAVGSFAVGQVE
jgi:hypothetical protein